MRIILLLFASLVMLVCSPAFAESGTVIITAGAKIADRDRSLAMNAAQARLREAGWEFTSQPLTTKEVQAVTTCLHNIEAWPCVSKVVEGHGIHRVAAISLRRNQTESGTPELIITGRLVVPDVELVVIGTRFCQQCTDDTLGELTTELTTALLQQAALDRGRTVLSIKSTPQGAIYTMDGVLKSATDALITVVPGTHVVTIEHDGYQTETRTIEAVEGKTAEVMVTLRRFDPIANAELKTQPSPVVERHSRALPITLVAVGSAAVAGGVIALSLNQSDQTKPADQRQPRFRYDTIVPGVAALAGGLALSGIGGYLWWRASRDDARSVATVVPVAGGAVVGMSGAF
jgi:hypothetical protein